MDNNKKNIKFAKLVAKWIKEGKLYFVDEPEVYGEPAKNSLCPVIEFAAGGDRIGNDGSGEFSWRDIMNMAESQGLL